VSLSLSELVDIAFLTFIGRTHVFDVLSNPKWRNTGIEHWVQTELIVAFTDRGYDVTTIGKVDRDCDLLINGVGVELRSGANPTPSAARDYYVNVFKVHPNADLYLFITPTTPEFEQEIINYCNANQITYIKKILDKDWIVMGLQ
jgi:hypothetical protein